MLEQAEVDTDIGLCRCFPFDIVVTDLVAFETGRKYTATVRTCDIVCRTVALSAERIGCTIVRCIDSITGKVGDFLITGLSPRSTQFQIIKPGQFFHEVLLCDTPSQRYGRESGITVVFTEPGRTVPTES